MIKIGAMAGQTIDALLGELVARGEVPGVVAAATDRDGVVFAGAYGDRALGGSAPMTLDTVFRIESMTKAFTAVACLQAVERGLVGLDEDLGGVLPALAGPLVLDTFNGGKPALRRATTPVTLRSLLTHTAGTAYEMWNTRIRDYVGFTGISREASFGRPENPLPFVSDPGTQWEYGVGMEWAGKVLEALTDKPLDVLFHDDIFAPLGMSSTGYVLQPDMRARLAATHQRAADGALTPHDDVVPDRPAQVLGGGGTFSTASDYLRFLRLLLNGGTVDGVTMLQPESVALFGTDQIGPLPAVPMRAALPLLSNDFDPLPGLRKGWGLGFEINHDPVPGRRPAGSYSWAGLRNTYYWVDPATPVAGVLMTQMLPFGDPVALHLLAEFERQLYAGLHAGSAEA